MSKRSEGQAGKAPVDMCGPYTTTIGGHQYLFHAVDAATGYIANYALRRKSDAVAVFRRCIVDLAHKAGTRIRSVRGDCDLLWTSNDFRDFCSTMGIAVQNSPSGAQQYNGVVESAVQRCNKISMASRFPAERRLGPGGFSCVCGLDALGTSSGWNRRRMPRRSSTRLLLLQTPVARRRRSCSPARRVLSRWCRFFSTVSCSGRGGRSWTTRQCRATSSTRATTMPNAV